MQVGDLVVCVDASDRGLAHKFINGYFVTFNKSWPLCKGTIYTIAGKGPPSWIDSEPTVYLEEIGVCPFDGSRWSFWADRFRPVRHTDISSIIEAMNRAPRELVSE